MYSVKAADFYIFSDSFQESLRYCRKAFEVLTKKDSTTDMLEYGNVSEIEYKKVLKVVRSALAAMADGMTLQAASQRLVFRVFNKKTADHLTQGFLDLEVELEASLRVFRKERQLRRSIVNNRKNGEAEDVQAIHKSNTEKEDAHSDWDASLAEQRVKKNKKWVQQSTSSSSPPVSVSRLSLSRQRTVAEPDGSSTSTTYSVACTIS